MKDRWWMMGVGVLALLFIVVYQYTEGSRVIEPLVLPQRDIFISPYLYIESSPKGGYGVFTSELLSKGTEIEVARLLPLKPYDREKMKELAHYDYNYSDDTTCIVFGFGSLYNHSADTNIQYHIDDKDLMHYATTRDVEPGEELFVNYGDEYFTSNKINQI